jgi:hypothetical protein
MVSKVGGNTIGIARRGQIWSTVIDYDNYITEHFLDWLMRIYDNIVRLGQNGKAVVNLSLSFAYPDRVSYGWIEQFRELLPTLSYFQVARGVS